MQRLGRQKRIRDDETVPGSIIPDRWQRRLFTLVVVFEQVSGEPRRQLAGDHAQELLPELGDVAIGGVDRATGFGELRRIFFGDIWALREYFCTSVTTSEISQRPRNSVFELPGSYSVI